MKYTIEQFLNPEQDSAIRKLLDLYHAGELDYLKFARLHTYVLYGWHLNLSVRDGSRYTKELDAVLGWRYEDHSQDPRLHFYAQQVPEHGHDDLPPVWRHMGPYNEDDPYGNRYPGSLTGEELREANDAWYKRRGVKPPSDDDDE